MEPTPFEMLVKPASDGCFALEFPYHKRAVAFVKALPGSTWDGARWLAPLRCLPTVLHRAGRVVSIDYEVLVAYDAYLADAGWWFIAPFLRCGHRVEVIDGVARLVGPCAEGVQSFVCERNAAIVAALESGRWPVKRIQKERI